MVKRGSDLQVTQERFWAKVVKTEGCWLWTGAITKGYGHVGLGGRVYYAHRVAYEWLVGPIPDGLELDHLCFTPACVNPDHLEPVTTAENVRRQAARMDYVNRRHRNQNKGKTHCIHGHPFDEANTIVTGGGRHCRACQRERNRRRTERLKKGTGPSKGEGNNLAKLTTQQVRAIRARYQAGESSATLAALYGVDRTNIWNIIARKTWKHVE